MIQLASLDERILAKEKELEELKKISYSQYDEKYNQAMEECKKLAQDPNADPNEVAVVEERVAEMDSKRRMGTPPFLPVECKYKAP